MSGGQIVGNTNSSTAAEVEATTLALRGTLRPPDFGAVATYGALSLAYPSGVIAAPLAAGSLIWNFTYLSSASNAKLKLLVRKIEFSAGVDSTGFTVGIANFQLFVSRSNTAASTGGTSNNPASTENRLRTTMSGAGNINIRVSNTAALTAGTRDRDPEPIGGVLCGVTATAGQILCPPTPLFEARQGLEHPLILDVNEGLELYASVPATGTWKFNVNMRWSEVTGYP